MGVDHTEDARSARRGLRRWFAPGVAVMTLLALAFALIASWVVWQRLTERHAGELAAFFALESAEIAMRIEERFRGYRQVLRGARGLFAASQVVERSEWYEYVRWLRLEEDYPGIQGVGFATWLAPQALEQHVLEMREAGFPYYRVWPGGVRDGYSAITFLEPFDWRNQRAFGFDMYSEPIRRVAMERAASTGRGALSGKVRLVQETERDRQAGVLLYLPIYAAGAPIATETERRRALSGWVFSPFRMNDLMHGLLGGYSEAVRLRVYDQVDNPEALLYDSHAGHEPRVAAERAGSHRLNVDGREWVLVVEALPGFASALNVQQTELIAIGLVGLLFVVVTWSFSTTRERARTLASLSESLRRSEARYSALVNLAHEGIAATDEFRRLIFVNPCLAELLGYEPAELIGRSLDDFCADEEAAVQMRPPDAVGGRYEAEVRRRDGTQWTALVSSAPLRDGAGRLRGTILMVTDISQRKEAERRIEHLATHDTLTGVPNRLMFTDLLTQAVGQARRYQHKCALLFVDLDRFKAVNDQYGHLIGDRLLVEAVGRMQASIRATDTLGRQGGDEFVVLLPEIDSGHDADVVAEKIRNALETVFVVDGIELHISSSIGIALYPEHGGDEDALLRCADEAMYRAKAEGRNRSRYYSG